MANPALINFIRQELRKGVPPERLKKDILEAGWGEADFNEAASFTMQEGAASAPQEEAPRHGLKDLEPTFSPIVSEVGYKTAEKISPPSQETAPKKEATPRGTREGKKSQEKKEEEAPEKTRDRFGRKAIVLIFLIAVIGGAALFAAGTVVELLKASNNLGTPTTPSQSETAVQKIRKGNATVAQQASSTSSSSLKTGLGRQGAPPPPGTPLTGTPFPSSLPPATTPPAPNGTPYPQEGGRTTSAPVQASGTLYTSPSPLQPQGGTASSPGVALPSPSYSTPLKSKTPLPPAVFPVTELAPSTPLKLAVATASRVTASSAEIFWKSNHLVFTRLDYGTSTSYGTSLPVSPLPSFSGTLVIKNLAPQTAHHYRLTVADGTGATAHSADASFTTPQAPAPQAGGKTPASSPSTENLSRQLQILEARLRDLLQYLSP